MIFISAGHNSKATSSPDPGAIGVPGKNGKPQKEGDLTIEFRDLVTAELKARGIKFLTDTDQETLAQYLSRIQSGPGSVVLEFHFDAGPATATGCTSIVGADADRLDKAFGAELAAVTSRILQIRNRGLIDEKESHRGRLGLMREHGTVTLLELAFISNAQDMENYHKFKYPLAVEIAKIVQKYEELVP